MAGAILSIPVALGGEAADANNTTLAVLAVASMVIGYVVLAALWFFVFREKARSRRKRDGSD